QLPAGRIENMNMMALDARLAGHSRPAGNHVLTVFIGAATPVAVAALNRAAEQGVPILCLGPGDISAELTVASNWRLFFSSAAPVAVCPVLTRLAEFFGLEEGFQINLTVQQGYEALRDELLPLLAQVLSQVKFSRHCGLLHLRCLLRNLPAICGEGARSLRLATAGATAVICGAGPSLEATAALLWCHRRDYFLIAVGHAVSRLRACGLLPDLVVEIDAECDRNWSEFMTEDVPLAAFPTVASPVPAGFRRLVWYGEPERENRLLPELLGLQLPPVAAARSVMVTALDLAVQAGFARIGMVGSDLCLADDGSIYGGGQGFFPGGEAVPGNDGGTVISLPALLGIREALERYAASCPQPLFNCTAGGARIAGFHWESLATFLAGAVVTPVVEFAPVPPHPAATELVAAWTRWRNTGEMTAVTALLQERLRRFSAQLRADAVNPALLADFPSRLLADLDRDIYGDPGGGRFSGPYRSAAFRATAIAAVRGGNPEYAAWLDGPEAWGGDPRFHVRSWLEALPEVRLAATGRVLSPGDNREHAAQERLTAFLHREGFDPARHFMVFVAPGDWQEVVRFARSRPGLPFAVLDPFPELFAAVIDYSVFFHYFPATTTIIAWGRKFRKAPRLLHALRRTVAGRDMTIMPRCLPDLADMPETVAAMTALCE
ncbi:MAG: DUF115 domain-containing protein, partial [Victivallales bacterium]|nr:DUF115 domain-containing protein [Victivallales bacterium]